MAAVAIGGSSTGGLLGYLLLPPYHRGVLERPTRKNYVMHPLAILSCQHLTKPWSMSDRTISYPTEMDKRQKYHLPSAVGEAFVSLGKVTTP